VFVNLKGFTLEVKISGVICKPLVIYPDQRGWLAEIFRQDEVAPDHVPVMAYVSVTQPGVGPGYQNAGDGPGYVCNFANRLDRGPGRLEPVDEFRFEDDPGSPFRWA
jgi:hypothetical protein